MLLRQSGEEISCRKLAQVIEINKNAAWHMLTRMKTATFRFFVKDYVQQIKIVILELVLRGMRLAKLCFASKI